MKTQRLVIFALLLVSPFMAGAQCASGQQTLNYDSSLTGFGNAYDPPYTFTFPKFDSSLGTLNSVGISSTISVNFTFSYENEATFARSVPQQKLFRSDYISSAYLPADLTFDQTYSGPPAFGPYPLAAADANPGTGADFVSVGPTILQSNNTVINSTITDSAALENFKGAGTVGFDYTTYTYAAPVITKFTYRSVANENIRFAMSYTYCPLTPLAQKIVSFSVKKTGNGKAQLHWAAANELPDHAYSVEKSADGNHFTNIDHVNAVSSNGRSANYTYEYNAAAGESRAFFRVGEQNKNGAWKYSPVREVSFGEEEKPGISIYPNPMNGAATITFGKEPADWDVYLVSRTGKALLHFSFNNTTSARLDLQGKLSKGIYFVKVMNRGNQQQFIEQIVLQ